MMKKAVFIVFLGIVGLSAIFAQAFPVDDSNGDIYTKKDNFGITGRCGKRKSYQFAILHHAGCF